MRMRHPSPAAHGAGQTVGPGLEHDAMRDWECGSPRQLVDQMIATQLVGSAADYFEIDPRCRKRSAIIYSVRTYRSSPAAAPRVPLRESADPPDQDGPSHTAAVARIPESVR
jgi:hypothetical protein